MNPTSREGVQGSGGAEPREGLKRDMSRYLEKSGFVDRVMLDILEIPGKNKKVLLWAGFCLLNLLLLVLLGTSPSVLVEILHEDLGQFFFLVLGISLLGGLIGLVMVSDISWLKEYLPKQDPDDEQPHSRSRTTVSPSCRRTRCETGHPTPSD